MQQRRLSVSLLSVSESIFDRDRPQNINNPSLLNQNAARHSFKYQHICRNKWLHSNVTALGQPRHQLRS